MDKDTSRRLGVLSEEDPALFDLPFGGTRAARSELPQADFAAQENAPPDTDTVGAGLARTQANMAGGGPLDLGQHMASLLEMPRKPSEQSAIPTKKDLGFGDDLMTSLSTGIDQTQGTIFGALGLAGDAFGSKDLASWGYEGYLRNVDEANITREKTGQREVSFRDLTEDFNFNDLAHWSVQTLGELAPTMAVGAVSAYLAPIFGVLGLGGAAAGATGTLGRSFVEKIAGKSVSKFADKYAKGVMDREGRRVLNDATKAEIRDIAGKAILRDLLAKSGFVSSTFVQEAGGMFGEAADKYGLDKVQSSKIVAAAVPAAALELFGGNIDLISRYMGKGQVAQLKKLIDTGKAKKAAEMILSVGKRMGAEAFQEAGQEFFAIASLIANNPEGSNWEELFSDESKWRMIESAAAGGLAGLGGGVVNAATGTKGDTLTQDEIDGAYRIRDEEDKARAEYEARLQAQVDKQGEPQGEAATEGVAAPQAEVPPDATFKKDEKTGEEVVNPDHEFAVQNEGLTVSLPDEDAAAQRETNAVNLEKEIKAIDERIVRALGKKNGNANGLKKKKAKLEAQLEEERNPKDDPGVASPSALRKKAKEYLVGKHGEEEADRLDKAGETNLLVLTTLERQKNNIEKQLSAMQERYDQAAQKKGGFTKAYKRKIDGLMVQHAAVMTGYEKEVKQYEKLSGKTLAAGQAAPAAVATQAQVETPAVVPVTEVGTKEQRQRRQTKLDRLTKAATDYNGKMFTRKTFEEDHKNEDAELVKMAADSVFNESSATQDPTEALNPLLAGATPDPVAKASARAAEDEAAVQAVVGRDEAQARYEAALSKPIDKRSEQDLDIIAAVAQERQAYADRLADEKPSVEADIPAWREQYKKATEEAKTANFNALTAGAEGRAVDKPVDKKPKIATAEDVAATIEGLSTPLAVEPQATPEETPVVEETSKHDTYKKFGKKVIEPADMTATQVRNVLTQAVGRKELNSVKTWLLDKGAKHKSVINDFGKKSKTKESSKPTKPIKEEVATTAQEKPAKEVKAETKEEKKTDTTKEPKLSDSVTEGIKALDAAEKQKKAAKELETLADEIDLMMNGDFTDGDFSSGEGSKTSGIPQEAIERWSVVVERAMDAGKNTIKDISEYLRDEEQMSDDAYRKVHNLLGPTFQYVLRKRKQAVPEFSEELLVEPRDGYTELGRMTAVQFRMYGGVKFNEVKPGSTGANIVEVSNRRYSMDKTVEAAKADAELAMNAERVIKRTQRAVDLENKYAELVFEKARATKDVAAREEAFAEIRKEIVTFGGLDPRQVQTEKNQKGKLIPKAVFKNGSWWHVDMDGVLRGQYFNAIGTKVGVDKVPAKGFGSRDGATKSWRDRQSKLKRELDYFESNLRSHFWSEVSEGGVLTNKRSGELASEQPVGEFTEENRQLLQKVKDGLGDEVFALEDYALNYEKFEEGNNRGWKPKEETAKAIKTINGIIAELEKLHAEQVAINAKAKAYKKRIFKTDKTSDSSVTNIESDRAQEFLYADFLKTYRQVKSALQVGNIKVGIMKSRNIKGDRVVNLEPQFIASAKTAEETGVVRYTKAGRGFIVFRNTVGKFEQSLLRKMAQADISLRRAEDELAEIQDEMDRVAEEQEIVGQPDKALAKAYREILDRDSQYQDATTKSFQRNDEAMTGIDAVKKAFELTPEIEALMEQEKAKIEYEVKQVQAMALMKVQDPDLFSQEDFDDTSRQLRGKQYALDLMRKKFGLEPVWFKQKKVKKEGSATEDAVEVTPVAEDAISVLRKEVGSAIPTEAQIGRLRQEIGMMNFGGKQTRPAAEKYAEVRERFPDDTPLDRMAQEEAKEIFVEPENIVYYVLEDTEDGLKLTLTKGLGRQERGAESFPQGRFFYIEDPVRSQLEGLGNLIYYGPFVNRGIAAQFGAKVFGKKFAPTAHLHEYDHNNLADADAFLKESSAARRVRVLAPPRAFDRYSFLGTRVHTLQRDPDEAVYKLRELQHQWNTNPLFQQDLLKPIEVETGKPTEEEYRIAALYSKAFMPEPDSDKLNLHIVNLLAMVDELNNARMEERRLNTGKIAELIKKVGGLKAFPEQDEAAMDFLIKKRDEGVIDTVDITTLMKKMVNRKMIARLDTLAKGIAYEYSLKLSRYAKRDKDGNVIYKKGTKETEKTTKSFIQERVQEDIQAYWQAVRDQWNGFTEFAEALGQLGMGNVKDDVAAFEKYFQEQVDRMEKMLFEEQEIIDLIDKEMISKRADDEANSMIRSISAGLIKTDPSDWASQGFDQREESSVEDVSRRIGNASVLTDENIGLVSDESDPFEVMSESYDEIQAHVKRMAGPVAGAWVEDTADALYELQALADTGTVHDYETGQSFGWKSEGFNVNPRKAHTGRISLVGKVVEGVKDLAMIGQVFRHPGYETVRYAFMRGNEVIFNEDYSSGLPNLSAMGPGSTAETLAHIKLRLKQLGADGFYILHNHPSGDATFSTEDIMATATIHDYFGDQLKGHVTVNRGAFGYYNLNWDKTGSLAKASFMEALETDDSIYASSMTEDMRRESEKFLFDANDAASLTRRIKALPDYTTAVFRTANGTVRGITQIQDSAGKNKDSLKKYLKTVAKNIGATQVIFVKKGPVIDQEAHNGFGSLVKDRTATAYLSWNESEIFKHYSEAGDVHSFRDSYANVFGVKGLPQMALYDSAFSKVQDITKEYTRLKLERAELSAISGRERLVEIDKRMFELGHQLTKTGFDEGKALPARVMSGAVYNPYAELFPGKSEQLVEDIRNRNMLGPIGRAAHRNSKKGQDAFSSIMPEKYKRVFEDVFYTPRISSEKHPIRAQFVEAARRARVYYHKLLDRLRRNENEKMGAEAFNKLAIEIRSDKKMGKRLMADFDRIVTLSDIMGKVFTEEQLRSSDNPLKRGLNEKVITLYKGFKDLIDRSTELQFQEMRMMSINSIPKDNDWHRDAVVLAQQGREKAPDGHKYEKEINAALSQIGKFRNELDEAKKTWRTERPFYAPRIRKPGSWEVRVSAKFKHPTTGEEVGPRVVFMQMTSTQSQAKKLRDAVIANPKQYLGDTFFDTSEEGKENWSKPEYIFHPVDRVKNSNDTENVRGMEMRMASLLTKAISRAKERTTGSKEDEAMWSSMRESMITSIADSMAMKGFGARKIKRVPWLVAGYKNTDYDKILNDHIAAQTNWLSKIQLSTKSARMLAEMDAREYEEDRRWAGQYISDLMAYDPWEQQAAQARSFAAIWFLGANLKSVLLNSFQNYVAGQAELSKYSKAPIPKLLKATANTVKYWNLVRAGGDPRAHSTYSRAGLTMDETRLLMELDLEGTTMEQFVREITGRTTERSSTAVQMVAEKSMFAFQWGETVLNRKPAALARYRVARDALKKKYPNADKHELYNAAKRAAEDFVDTVHYMYGKENRPHMAMGAVGSTLYVFQSFSHQFLTWLWHRAMVDGEYKVVARALGAIVALGGLPALPLLADAGEILERFFGKSFRIEFKKYLAENEGEYEDEAQALFQFLGHGITGFAGVDMSRALAVQLPAPATAPFFASQDTSFGERLTGAWGSLGKKAWWATRSASTGDWQRTLEYLMPEAIANPIRAIRQTEGLTTIAGKKIYGTDREQLRYTTGEAVRKALGFVPSRIASEMAVRNVSMNFQDYFDGRKASIKARYRRAEPGEERLKVWNDFVMPFNRDLNESQAVGLVNPINIKDLLGDRDTPKKAETRWLANTSQLKTKSEVSEVKQYEPPPAKPKVEEAPPQAPPKQARSLGEVINQGIAFASKQTGVDPHILRAMITIESSGDPNAVSSVGARGLLQMTESAMRQIGFEGNIHDPAENILAGAMYFAYLKKQFPGAPLTHLVAAYNTGEGNLRKYGYEKVTSPNWNKEKNPGETGRHVQKVMAKYRALKRES